MEKFIIDVPVPSMGATVSELNVIVIKVQAGDQVTKGQRLADLESDKSAFEFESPCDGVVHAVLGKPGATMTSGEVFLQMETTDESLRHLQSQTATKSETASTPAKSAGAVIWTPRATKLAQEAGLDPAKITDIEATGPGNRVSGDDVQRYIESHKG
ncbi:MAG: E3 binding domain-containing protein [Cephaloticoccus sp.]|nr:E3 binding domain-containing protein [Cephaloticoccus sp.]MCF7761955.1 E3 binding domain-containing protein [Cephaloticoccus sp.]